MGVLLGMGDGSFEAAAEFFAENFPIDVHLVDMDRDGALDVVLVNRNDPDNPDDQATPRVGIHFGSGDGVFDFDNRVAYTAGGAPSALAVADLNSDNHFEAITLHPADSRLYIMLGKPEGKLATPQLRRTALDPQALVAVDTAGNSLPDLVTTHAQGAVGVLINQGSSVFSGAMVHPLGTDPTGLAVGDLDADGRPDVVVSNGATNDIAVAYGASAP